MIQLVKDGNHLLVKRLVHKSGQTECDVVQHFHAVEQMPLNLKGATASAHMHGAVWEPYRSYACLQPVAGAGARQTDTNQQLRGVDMPQFLAAIGYGTNKCCHGGAKVEWPVSGASIAPWGCCHHRLVLHRQATTFQRLATRASTPPVDQRKTRRHRMTRRIGKIGSSGTSRMADIFHRLIAGASRHGRIPRGVPWRGPES